MIEALRERFGEVIFKKQVHQVTSIIFRNVPNEELSILLLERVDVPNRKFSGDLCYPGGNIDDGQTPQQAVIRETLEQTNIDLKSCGSLIGKLNFLQQSQTSKKKGQKKKITYLGYFLYQITSSVQIKLNSDEIVSYYWVPVRKFLTFKQKDFIFSHKKLQPLKEDENMKNVKYFSFSGFDIGLHKVFFGITLTPITQIIWNLAQTPNILARTGYQITNQYYWKIYEHFGTALVQYLDGKKQVVNVFYFYKIFTENKITEYKPKL